MNIQHNPIFDTEKVARLYTEKDRVPVKYVCTSAPNKSGTCAADIFYRDTPHPKFGNRYFGLYTNPYSGNAQIMITNADKIEDLSFEMIEIDGVLQYSQHRHDYRDVGRGICIDGGREYSRFVFSDRKVFESCPRKVLKVKDGEFVEVSNDT